MLPLQSALVAFVGSRAGRSYADISRVLLATVEGAVVDHLAAVVAVVKSIAPSATVHAIRIKRSTRLDA